MSDVNREPVPEDEEHAAAAGEQVDRLENHSRPAGEDMGITDEPSRGRNS